MKGDFVKWVFASVCVNANELCLSVVQLRARTQWRQQKLSQLSLLQSAICGYVTITLNQAYHSEKKIFRARIVKLVTRAVALLALPKLWSLI